MSDAWRAFFWKWGVRINNLGWFKWLGIVLYRYPSDGQTLGSWVSGLIYGEASRGRSPPFYLGGIERQASMNELDRLIEAMTAQLTDLTNIENRDQSFAARHEAGRLRRLLEPRLLEALVRRHNLIHNGPRVTRGNMATFLTPEQILRQRQSVPELHGGIPEYGLDVARPSAPYKPEGVAEPFGLAPGGRTVDNPLGCRCRKAMLPCRAVIFRQSTTISGTMRTRVISIRRQSTTVFRTTRTRVISILHRYPGCRKVRILRPTAWSQLSVQ